MKISVSSSWFRMREEIYKQANVDGEYYRYSVFHGKLIGLII